MLTSEAMVNLAAELTDATAEGDAEPLAAIAWQLYGEAGENPASPGPAVTAGQPHAAHTSTAVNPP